jgi:hypothetical protein
MQLIKLNNVRKTVISIIYCLHFCLIVNDVRQNYRIPQFFPVIVCNSLKLTDISAEENIWK